MGWWAKLRGLCNEDDGVVERIGELEKTDDEAVPLLLFLLFLSVLSEMLALFDMLSFLLYLARWLGLICVEINISFCQEYSDDGLLCR